MPGPFAVRLQTPALADPTGWSGYIQTVYEASVTRGINRAGSFTVSFPMAANEATQVVRGWRCTILQERLGVTNSAGAAFNPPALLYQGKVLRRTPIIDEAGGVTMVLEGETYLGQLADSWIQTEKTFEDVTLNAMLTDLLSGLGISYTTPARCATETFSVKLSDLTVLHALIRLAELTRTNLVDTFTNAIKFTDMDNLPDPATNICADDTVLRLLNVEGIDPVDAVNAPLSGIGVITGPPTVLYDGSQLANKIKAIGATFDGDPLTLEDADAGEVDVKYPPQMYAGPAANYFVVEDAASQAMYGLTEVQLVRSDMKPWSDDPAHAAAAKRALLAIASGELLRRRSEILTMQLQLAGENIYALPGEKVWVRYKGVAKLTTGNVTVMDVDRWMVVTRRYDKAGEAGHRLIGLDVSSPEIAYTTPDVPDEVHIQTPHENQLPPEKDLGEELEDLPLANNEIPYWPIEEVAKIIELVQDHGEFQPCCADPMVDIGGPGDNDGIPMPQGLGG